MALGPAPLFSGCLRAQRERVFFVSKELTDMLDYAI
jgi:hypothetical protein